MILINIHIFILSLIITIFFAYVYFFSFNFFVFQEMQSNLNFPLILFLRLNLNLNFTLYWLDITLNYNFKFEFYNEAAKDHESNALQRYVTVRLYLTKDKQYCLQFSLLIQSKKWIWILSIRRGSWSRNYLWKSTKKNFAACIYSRGAREKRWC